jgi:recombinational DNA repair protein RecR
LAHNLKVVSSNLAPATNFKPRKPKVFGFFSLHSSELIPSFTEDVPKFTLKTGGNAGATKTAMMMKAPKVNVSRLATGLLFGGNS